MSFRNNGRKREPKFLFGSVFMFVIGLLIVLMSFKTSWNMTWTVIGGIILLLSILMFKNANEQ